MNAARLVCLLAIATLSIAAIPSMAEAQHGQVAGRVVEAGTGEALTGAQVVVSGTSIGAVTDENGRYLLPRVPAGSQTLEATYLGYTEASTTVNVADDQLANANFTLEVSAIAQPELVVGIRASGQAEALSQQKAAPNIKNIVASDQMGRFPDASAPEAIQRVPGVALERDQGEGRYIQIRGGSAANTQVTVNGEQVPSPEAEIRQIGLDAVPVEVLDAIAVSKAITPDMDTEAIGGSVNLITKQAPEDMLFSVEGSGGYAPIRDEPSGSGSLTWGTRTSDGKLGFLASGSFSPPDVGSDDPAPAPVKMSASFRTRSASGTWYPGPSGILAWAMLPPDEQSTKSTPSGFNAFASSTDWSMSHPPSTQSVAERRINNGSSCGHASRT